MTSRAASIPGLGRLRRCARWMNRQVTGSALILLYHRVADVRADPQLLCVTPKNFSEQMAVLREIGHPVPLSNLVNELRNSRLRRRSILVTFDDGYADNLHNAKPILERFDVPATVFVATGYLQDQREYWWDELQRLLLQPGSLPATLALCGDGVELEWQLGDSSTYPEEESRKHEHWNVVGKQIPTARHALYLALHEKIRFLPSGQRTRLLESLRIWAGYGPDARDTHRPATVSEAQELDEGGLVEVGAHTVTHPVLSSIGNESQRTEIEQSKHFLEEILNRSVTSFAYPYGRRQDYKPETVTAVRDAGFACACSNYPGLVWKRSDGFQLPRALVGNWDGEEFTRRIREWLVN